MRSANDDESFRRQIKSARDAFGQIRDVGALLE